MNSFIITSHLHTSFRKIGAFVQALPVPAGSRRVRGEVRRRITVRDRTFEFTLSPNTLAVVSDWHRVYINTEVRPASLGFLD